VTAGVSAVAAGSTVSTGTGAGGALGSDLGGDLGGVGGGGGGQRGGAVSLGLGLVQVGDGGSQLVGSLLGAQLGHLQWDKFE
jgi:hypothetical protein